MSHRGSSFISRQGNGGKRTSEHQSAQQKFPVDIQGLSCSVYKDKFLAHIWEHTDRFNKFLKQKDLLWTNNRMGSRVVCIPDGLLKGKSLKGLVLNTCHQTIGHLGVE